MANALALARHLNYNSNTTIMSFLAALPVHICSLLLYMSHVACTACLCV